MKILAVITQTYTHINQFENYPNIVHKSQLAQNGLPLTFKFMFRPLYILVM